MIRKILIAVDESEEATRALDFLSCLIHDKGIHIHIIHVVKDIKIPNEIIHYMRAEGIGESPESVYLQMTGNRIVREAETKIKKLGVHNLKSVLIMGDPATEIVKYSREFGIDTIIIGARGENSEKDEGLGSVCSKVCNTAERTCIIVRKDLLENKRILVVDDEPDVLDTIDDLLPQCDIVKASSFDKAVQFIQNQTFDLVIIDIMGVNGYELLNITHKAGIIGVIMTGHAVSLENTWRAYRAGAASYIPKDELPNIATYLTDIFEAKKRGKHFWWRWLERFNAYYERRFGSHWRLPMNPPEKDQDKHPDGQNE